MRIPIFGESPPNAILLSMQYTLAHIGPRSSSGDEFNSLTQLYLDRTSTYVPCEAMSFRKQEDLLEWLTRRQGKPSPIAVLLDSRGRQMTSEAFAAWLGARRDEGSRHI